MLASQADAAYTAAMSVVSPRLMLPPVPALVAAPGGAVLLSPDGEVETLTLARKVTSTVGLAEIVPVRRNGGQAEPMAVKYLPFSSLARSDGWILVPADSEGYSAGSAVALRPWP